MARYSLNLPTHLKQEAEQWAGSQGVSLNQFILWAVAEKVGSLSQSLDDTRFPQVTWRRGGSGDVAPVLRGHGIKVRTLITAIEAWGWSTEKVAEEYGVSKSQVEEALAFYDTHRVAIDHARELDREAVAVGN